VTRPHTASAPPPHVTLCLDVSGKEHQHRAVTAAGYIASDAQWASFERAWRAILADAGAAEFHATDFFSGQRAFAHLDPRSAAHRTLAARFARACYDQLPNGFAYTIDVPAFHAWMTEVTRRMRTPTSRLRPSTWAISAVCNRIAQRCLPRTGPKATLSLEDGDGTGEALAWLRYLVRLGEPWTAAYVAFEAIPKASMGAQAADYLAYESWREATRVLDEPGRGWDDTRETFKMLATGPAMRPPSEGGARVDLQYASADHFPEWERGFTKFLDENARYSRAPMTPDTP
jgi:hypothetical protein